MSAQIPTTGHAAAVLNVINARLQTTQRDAADLNLPEVTVRELATAGHIQLADSDNVWVAYPLQQRVAALRAAEESRRSNPFSGMPGF